MENPGRMENLMVENHMENFRDLENLYFGGKSGKFRDKTVVLCGKSTLLCRKNGKIYTIM